jgi:hypothetical protein
MRSLSIIKLAGLLLATSTFAAPAPTPLAEIDDSNIAFDTTGLTPEQFVASDGVEHTIVRFHHSIPLHSLLQKSL